MTNSLAQEKFGPHGGEETHQTNETLHAETEPFVVPLHVEDKQTLLHLAARFTLRGLIRDSKNRSFLYKRRGQTFSDKEQRMINLMTSLREKHEESLKETPLLFRWVSATPEINVDELTQSALAYGGNPVTDESSWIHASATEVVADFMRNDASSPGLLLIYDQNKLAPITEEDRATDLTSSQPKATYMYAQRPLPGLELKNTLVGIIRFDK